jgi:hypothetical protein
LRRLTYIYIYMMQISAAARLAYHPGKYIYEYLPNQF